MVESDDFDSMGIDLDEALNDSSQDFESKGVDLDGDLAMHQEKKSTGAGFWGTVGDIFTQAGRGALKAFTWPADVLKLGMIGEGLTDLDELEESFKKAGKPFDRKKYVQGVFEAAQYIPTQELAEKGFEKVSGISLEPKTELGRIAKQGSELASFTPGGAAKKLTSAATGVAATQALEKFGGLDKAQAELIGDVASLGPSLITKGPKAIPSAADLHAKTAQKHALPFMDYMVKERAPLVKGRLFQSTEEQLKKQFDLSTAAAMNKIVRNELPVKRLQDKGVNLDALANHAYEVTDQLAKSNPKIINTSKMVNNIESEISRIRALAPSPSDSQNAAIKILEEQRDILKVAKPNSEQLINQHMNYNNDMKSLYRKPEFSGKEEQVRKAYEFLKNQQVEAIAEQGGQDVANAFKAANKIYHEKSKLNQTESLLQDAFKGDKYDPKRLDKILNSKRGNFLKRNLSKDAINDLQQIADYGKVAQENMSKFIDLRSPSVMNEVKAWGQLAPLIFLPHNLQGALLAAAKPLARHIQGKLLTRPALRETYKLTLKHAADGAYNLLKKDFMKLEQEIAQEWGTVDNFMDDMLEELDFEEA